MLTLSVVAAASQTQKQALLSCVACLASRQLASAEMLVRGMHSAIAHPEWRSAYSHAYTSSLPTPASSSSPQASAVSASTANTVKQTQLIGNVLERSLQTLLRAGQLDKVWDMLLQIYPQLQVGVKQWVCVWYLETVWAHLEVAALERQDLSCTCSL